MFAPVVERLKLEIIKKRRGGFVSVGPVVMVRIIMPTQAFNDSPEKTAQSAVRGAAPNVRNAAGDGG
jgi:hypothetical protein